MSVGDVKLDHPLTYFVDSRRGIRNEEPAAIDLALLISASANQPTARELPYWPTYEVSLLMWPRAHDGSAEPWPFAQLTRWYTAVFA